MNREACSLLAETIGIILGEFADDPDNKTHRNQVYKEAEYLAKKSWIRSSVVGHIAIKYGALVNRRAVSKGGGKSARKRKVAELDENGLVFKYLMFTIF